MAEKRRARMAKPEKLTVKQQALKADEKVIDEKLEEIIEKL